MRPSGIAAVLVGSMGLAGFTDDAHAGATIDLLFTGINSSPIAATDTVTVSAASGDTLTMVVRMTNDEPVRGGAFMLNYDPGELDVVSVFGSSGGLAADGSAGTFGPSVGSPLAPGTRELGSVVWVTTGATSDGVDILAQQGYAEIFYPVTFHSATVNLVPEPGTALLVGLGLAGLALGRSGRRV